MGFFARIFSKGKKEAMIETNQASSDAIPEESYSQRLLAMGLAKPVSPEEKEMLAVITSAIMVGDNPDSRVRVSSVVEIDTNKEVAGVIASAVAAGDYPNSHFRLKGVTEI